MRILVVSQRFYPENFHVNEICEELVNRGHKVTVITGLPNYPEGYVPDEYKNGKKRRETVFGADIIRCNEIGRRKNVIFLMLNYISFAFSGWKMAGKLKDEYDVICM